MSKSDAEPVLITGMHRSGTGALAASLRRLGLFTGWDLDANEEARFFVRLDDAILKAANARWDQPDPCAAALADDVSRTMLARRIAPRLDSIMIARYVGPARLLSRSFPWLDKRPWGWKDPRLIFTLPLWRDIFPKARVIHLARHGVDVAASLVRRSQAATITTGRSDHCIHEYGAESSAVSPRCSEIEGAFSLWEEYMRNASRVIAPMESRAISIRFEELVENPHASLARLAGFCGLQTDARGLAGACAALDRSKAFTFKNNPALRDFALAMRDRLAACGYQESE